MYLKNYEEKILRKKKYNKISNYFFIKLKHDEEMVWREGGNIAEIKSLYKLCM